jgi:hypothetical protein
MIKMNRRPSTIVTRAILAAFLVSLPGSRDAFAQVITKVGVAVPGAVGSIGAALNGPSIMPVPTTTLSIAPLSAPSALAAPMALPVPVATVVAAAIVPKALNAAVVPANAKAVLVRAAAGAKIMTVPSALSGGGVKSAAAKPFDGSDGKGPGDSDAPAFVPSALTSHLSAPSAVPPDAAAPTTAQLNEIRSAIRTNFPPGDVLNRSSVAKLATASTPALKAVAALEALTAAGELAKLSDGMYIVTEAWMRNGTGEGDLKQAHHQVMAGVRQLNAGGNMSVTRSVALLGDALKLLTLAKAPEPVIAEVTVLYNNAVLEMTRKILGNFEAILVKKGEATDSPDRARIAAAQNTLKGRAFAVDSPEPALFTKEMGEWLASIYKRLQYPAEERAKDNGLLDAGVVNFQAFHRRGAPSADGKPGNLESLEGLEARMKAIGMPPAIQEVTKREFNKLLQMNPKDSEAQKARTYVEWLTDLPWGVRSEDQVDIAAARVILDRDHAGLDAVKDRVLEFLAVRKKTGSKKGAIIAFTGPPGVGKTSIAGAIAQALGRKFVRLSLGGVHDESVLRGHGRTYTGSMPGEIMRQMKNAGTINPVMLMDEVDKIGRNGAQGDPTAALLEVLDPEQNNTFRDRYLDVPYDLSEVLFVVTSNELANIPAPLRDRMEIIEFDGYTTLEKIAIAEKHIVPQKLAATGLKPEEAALTRNAIRAIIEGYTMEAGVRNLREKIETLMRKISAWTETKGEPAPGAVDETMISKYLGVERFSPRQIAQNGVGVATGLAVNTFGGSTLNVEVSKEPGTGQLKLRKQFGDDIEDSAKNALKYVKQNAAKFGLQDFDFTKHDIDINITPAGKVDGPSAGGLMVTAIISALTGRSVTPGLAMTGEITMRGDILPIGGLKQKVMAAHRMGYKEVIFPYANLKDIENIPKEVRDGIKLTPAKTYDDIYPSAIVK